MCPYLLGWTTGHHNFMQKSHFLYYNGKCGIICVYNYSISYTYTNCKLITRWWSTAHAVKVNSQKESDTSLPTHDLAQYHGSIASLHRRSNPLP